MYGVYMYAIGQTLTEVNKFWWDMIGLTVSKLSVMCTEWLTA